MNGPRRHDWIDRVAPYVPGDSAVPGVEHVVKLSSNEAALGPGPHARAAAAEAAGGLATYPDSHHTALRAAIASAEALPAERLVCEAGSEQLLNLIARCYAGPGTEVLHSRYGFIAFAVAARSCGATPVAADERDHTADVDALLARVSARTRVVFLANPNNPTGTMLPFTEIRRLRARLPEAVLLVLDGAYAEFVDDPDYADGRSLVADQPGNTVILHSFSKIHGLAALRVGWAYGPAAVVDTLNRLRGVFTVSSAAQAAAAAAVHDVGHIQAARAHNRHWRHWLREALAARGLRVLPAHGNFVCVVFADAAQASRAALALRTEGYIPRQLEPYGLDHGLRITVGLERHNRAVAEILAAGAARQR